MRSKRITARIRRVSDGLEREYVFESLFDEDDGEVTLEGREGFMWAEGNYSCDCNRAAFFAQAADEDEPHDRTCGDEVRFQLLSLTREGEAESFWTPEIWR